MFEYNSKILIMIFYFFPGELYGLEKFWAFKKYFRHAQSLRIQDRLLDKLSQYKTIDDFRLPPDRKVNEGSSQGKTQKSRKLKEAN